MCRPTTKCFIVGDINIDFNKYDSSAHVQRHVYDLFSMNFIPFTVLLTHYTGASVTTIDHLWSNLGLRDSNNSSIKSLTATVDINDHFANIILLISSKRRVNYHDRPFIGIFSHNNIEKFRSRLANVN